ncbi:MAG: orotidine-5'-phosphate decarboxylase [Acidimicrobiales bacterium]
MRPFGERVVQAVQDTGPLCVGVDPSPSLLEEWGIPDDATGLADFSSRCIEALAGAVPVVKPQVAFFERHGAAGMAALERLLADAASAGLLVIADAKRGDIGSTTAAYADAWFRSPFAGDALTATPYVGLGALEPLCAAARETGCGVFVVVATSNPEGRALQAAVRADGATVECALLAEIAACNAAERAETGALIGSLGAVVGATRRDLPLEQLGGVLLVPGLGAQGGSVDDVAAGFGTCPRGTVLPSTSRGLLRAGPSALRAAALRLRDELAGSLR